jgi:Na+:H+ antiporter, NhaC family
LIGGSETMDLIFSVFISFVLLILSVHKGIFVGYALSISLVMFIAISMRRGFKLADVVKMAFHGSKKSTVVLQILLMIGAVTASWMACGTVPAIVYYGIKFINPKLFILSAFLISCFVSFLIGTAYGTVGTVGIALMILSRSGGSSSAAAAGAIIAGGYFGDRCSAMSSSANLVAGITDTDIYTNIKNMAKTSVAPFIIAVVIYIIVSLSYPLHSGISTIGNEILNAFTINIITLIPAIIILVLSIFKVNVKKSMFLSIAAAVIISITIEHVTAAQIIKYIVFGYSIDGGGPLAKIIKGGGMLSMLTALFVIFISSALTGIFEGTEMLKSIEEKIEKSNSRFNIFGKVIITAVVTSIVGCSQALSVIMTHMLCKSAYTKNELDKYSLAVDLENSAICIPSLIPWNIALLVPLINLNAGASSIVFMFYTFLVPICNLIYFKFEQIKTAKMFDNEKIL